MRCKSLGVLATLTPSGERSAKGSGLPKGLAAWKWVWLWRRRLPDTEELGGGPRECERERSPRSDLLVGRAPPCSASIAPLTERRGASSCRRRSCSCLLSRRYCRCRSRCWCRRWCRLRVGGLGSMDALRADGGTLRVRQSNGSTLTINPNNSRLLFINLHLFAFKE